MYEGVPSMQAPISMRQPISLPPPPLSLGFMCNTRVVGMVVQVRAGGLGLPLLLILVQSPGTVVTTSMTRGVCGDRDRAEKHAPPTVKIKPKSRMPSEPSPWPLLMFEGMTSSVVPKDNANRSVSPGFICVICEIINNRANTCDPTGCPAPLGLQCHGGWDWCGVRVPIGYHACQSWYCSRCVSGWGESTAVEGNV